MSAFPFAANTTTAWMTSAAVRAPHSLPLGIASCTCHQNNLGGVAIGAIATPFQSELMARERQIMVKPRSASVLVIQARNLFRCANSCRRRSLLWHDGRSTRAPSNFPGGDRVGRPQIEFHKPGSRIWTVLIPCDARCARQLGRAARCKVCDYVPGNVIGLGSSIGAFQQNIDAK
jgi:hypothetical protein